jgi:predicted  nucleic acid-binding Zn ribbon protein
MCDCKDRQDLTLHSEDELSLIVFNNESLYRQRNNPRLENILEQYFNFTIEQFQVLAQDIQDERNEVI